MTNRHSWDRLDLDHMSKEERVALIFSCIALAISLAALGFNLALMFVEA